ncbi:hypothetical protein Bhyg_14403 [Pseudolycoriella hygida]|uniref:Uncharacterized protein n=1 Tax=Pseudolycoriella hygida TaxID=35572 RepID=A0A9Q0RX74_9DIPT|nr:hypothetical protein Bhyg_14403 [Pseudolycoriella hygida]
MSTVDGADELIQPSN